MSQKIHTILLVDDDPDDQMLFSEALSEANAAVIYTSANDGVEALEQLNPGGKPLPDLIFMDVNMPRMDGISCLKEIRKIEQLRGIPVVMYSTSSYYQKECYEYGALDYIEKPTDYSKLCNTLKNILSSHLPASM
ncbi:response regulator [Flavobacterium sp. 3HN19-14]|uniref:response regulator n=1 Tax=Flavobacterium sp. 3HN19-14 TaxID=3448133 RepID=UPI003EE17911